MADLEQENATYRETLAQFQGKMDTFQGNMNTILEYLQAQKATTSTSDVDPASVVVTDAIVVTIFVDAIVDTVIQYVVSQPSYQPGPSRHVIAYPWGLPLNFTPQASNGNAFVPYQSFVVHSANGNSIVHPWGMTTRYPQMVNVYNREIHPEQVLQTSTPVIVETPNNNEDEYIGHTLHFRLPHRATQPTAQNMNQGIQIPPPHPGSSSAVAPPFVYPGDPYAPYQN